MRAPLLVTALVFGVALTGTPPARAQQHDLCPDDPEDFDGFQDEDGCPDPDNDQDGILDIDDKCPNDPEDKDGFEDDDGCPDPDNDGDGILDVNDRCPNEPETFNDFEDTDGCPDRGPAHIVGRTIEIADQINFVTDSAIIDPVSFPILDAIARVLADNPGAALVEIQGHSDERASAAHNLRLTRDRADAVKQYLVDHGVAANRLAARGYGSRHPLCTGHTRECWSRNRRVAFVILR